MFVFIIKILLGVLLVVWFSMMFVEIFNSSRNQNLKTKLLTSKNIKTFLELMTLLLPMIMKR
jgi:hypothetical protein